MRARTLRTALALLLSAAAPALAADVPAFELEHLILDPGASASLVVGGGSILPAGDFRVAVAAHYERAPLLLLRDGTELGDVVRSRLGAHALAAWSPTSWLQLGANVPFVLSQTGDDLSSAGLAKPASSSVGTPWLDARLAPLAERRGQGFDLALGVAVGLPVGDRAALARDEGVVILPMLGLGKRLGPIRLAGEGGVWLRQTQALSVAGKDEVGRQLVLGAAIATAGSGARLELAGRSYLGLTNQPNAGEVLAGARLPFAGRFELFALGGPGVGRSPGTPSFRALAGLAIGATAEPPAVALPACTDDSAPASECPDRDADGDGVRNGVDRCPFEPEDVDGFEDADGCADPDNDRDSIPDASDKCPLVPGDARFRGCPVPDADKDGVLDADDRCPKQPGPPERRGCPIADRDGDGIEDAADACIDQKGTAENHGCPAEKKQLVAIRADRLAIFEKVFFDTGKATIKPRSFALLDQIAKVLGEHPEIQRIAIEGHTDSRGKAAKNRKLSHARAESVRAYLIGQGVAADRLSAKGYGPDRPTDTNKTARGREANRRVEFVIAGPAEEKR